MRDGYMSNKAKLQILKSIFGQYEPDHPEYLFLCPHCNHHKKKLSINVDKNAYKCWVCGKSGRDAFQLVRRFGTYEHAFAWKQIGDDGPDLATFGSLFEKENQEEREMSLPYGYESLIGNKTKKARNAKEYLSWRGITEEDIILWKIGYCDSGYLSERIIVPSFDRSGIMNYYVARTYSKKSAIPYVNPSFRSNMVIFNELNLDFKKDLNIVEGVFNAFKAGQNSAPLLGSTLNPRSRLFQKIVKYDTPIFFALDEDAIMKELKIIKLLLKYGNEVYKIPIDKGMDVGKMTKEEYQDRKQNAIFLDNDNILWYETQMRLKGI
jgi:hypothetical protein